MPRMGLQVPFAPYILVVFFPLDLNPIIYLERDLDQ